jgi:hypothetical protein
MRLSTRILSAAVLPALALFFAQSCASMDKVTLERRLLDLQKNGPVRAAGLETGEHDVTLAGQETHARFTWHHAGQRGRPVLVLVHGTPSSLFTWTELIHGGPGIDGLERDFEIFALDMLGHAGTLTQLRTCSSPCCSSGASVTSPTARNASRRSSRAACHARS